MNEMNRDPNRDPRPDGENPASGPGAPAAAPSASAPPAAKPASTDDPLVQALRMLAYMRRLARIASFVPLPLILLVGAGFTFWQPHWYLDPFMVVILAVFIVGQVAAFRQVRKSLSAIRSMARVVKILREAGAEPDLEALRKRLLESAPPGILRDLVLRWVDLGLRGETTGSQALLENASDRRFLQDQKTLSFHVMLNRTTLKLGFLGTLIGLVMTFPPMQNAIRSLAESDGELRFIEDIAKALDGDKYAIVTTLAATALSMLIELVILLILERIFSGFDVVTSHMNDWNLSRLQPWIRRRYGPEAREKDLKEARERQALEMLKRQEEMDANIQRLASSLAKTAGQLEHLARFQNEVGQRLEKLLHYEQEYRSFLAGKEAGVAPPPLRPQGRDGNFPQKPLAGPA